MIRDKASVSVISLSLSKGRTLNKSYVIWCSENIWPPRDVLKVEFLERIGNCGTIKFLLNLLNSFTVWISISQFVTVLFDLCFLRPGMAVESNLKILFVNILANIFSLPDVESRICHIQKASNFPLSCTFLADLGECIGHEPGRSNCNV